MVSYFEAQKVGGFWRYRCIVNGESVLMEVEYNHTYTDKVHELWFKTLDYGILRMGLGNGDDIEWHDGVTSYKIRRA